MSSQTKPNFPSFPSGGTPSRVVAIPARVSMWDRRGYHVNFRAAIERRLIEIDTAIQRKHAS